MNFNFNFPSNLDRVKSPFDWFPPPVTHFGTQMTLNSNGSLSPSLSCCIDQRFRWRLTFSSEEQLWVGASKARLLQYPKERISVGVEQQTRSRGTYGPARALQKHQSNKRPPGKMYTKATPGNTRTHKSKSDHVVSGVANWWGWPKCSSAIISLVHTLSSFRVYLQYVAVVVSVGK